MRYLMNSIFLVIRVIQLLYAALDVHVRVIKKLEKKINVNDNEALVTLNNGYPRHMYCLLRLNEVNNLSIFIEQS